MTVQSQSTMFPSVGHTVVGSRGSLSVRPCFYCWLSSSAERSLVGQRARQPKPNIGDAGQQESSSPLTCPRAVCQELSTYTLETPVNTGLLERCAQEAVLHLDEAPCLHFSSSNGTVFTRQPLPEALAASRTNCQGISELVRENEAELLLLVQRVPDGRDHSPGMCWKLHMEADRLGNIQRESPRVLQLWAQRSDPMVRKNIVAGTVGDCCEGEEDHNHDELLNVHAASDYGGPAGTTSCHTETAFWGLVIQSQVHTGVEGCYLLKTVRNVDHTGCSCTHFSLTSVCKDIPLCQQYQGSWLV